MSKREIGWDAPLPRTGGSPKSAVAKVRSWVEPGQAKILGGSVELGSVGCHNHRAYGARKVWLAYVGWRV
jgi:hypothetical protein